MSIDGVIRFIWRTRQKCVRHIFCDADENKEEMISHTDTWIRQKEQWRKYGWRDLDIFTSVSSVTFFILSKSWSSVSLAGPPPSTSQQPSLYLTVNRHDFFFTPVILVQNKKSTLSKSHIDFICNSDPTFLPISHKNE